MGFKKAVWRILFFSVLLWASTAWAASDKSEPGQILVRVLNHARIRQAEIISVEAEAGRIFRAAGIEIRWVDCSKRDCHEVLGTNEFVLNIVPDGRTTSDLVFGVAFLGPNGEGKYADVFFRRIEAASACDGQNISRMLGTVAAHELGHLLLGSHAHSGGGIMNASWGKETLLRLAMGNLLFTRDQAALMKARMGGNGLFLARGGKAERF